MCIRDRSRPAQEAGIFVHNKIHSVEKDNSGVEGAHKSEELAERGAKYGTCLLYTSTLVVALGAGLGIWGVINLMEGYGNDNPGAKSQGMKQFMAN